MTGGTIAMLLFIIVVVFGGTGYLLRWTMKTEKKDSNLNTENNS